MRCKSTTFEELEELRERTYDESLQRPSCLGDGLCPECGSTFGMFRVYLDVLEEHPLHRHEEAYHCETDPPSADYVWMVCPACNQAGVIPTGFVSEKRMDMQAIDPEAFVPPLSDDLLKRECIVRLLQHRELACEMQTPTTFHDTAIAVWLVRHIPAQLLRTASIVATTRETGE